MGEFICDTVIEGALLTLRPTGYIDDFAGNQLLSIVQRGFTQGVTKLLLNLSDSPVINSPGVSRLLEITEGIEERRGKMAIVGLSTVSERFFQMAGILDEAETFSDEASARASLGV